jgi:hypothetical protein
MIGGTHLSARSPPMVSPPSPATSPELLPRLHRDLIVHQDPSIKGPNTPSRVSLFLFTQDAARTVQFLIGAPPTCRHPRSIPTLPVNPALSSLPYLLPLSLAPPLTFFFCFNSQLIELLIDDRSHTAATVAPAAPLLCTWKRSTMSFTFPRSPCRSEHCLHLRRPQNSPEAHRSSTSGRTSPETRWNPSFNR